MDDITVWKRFTASKKDGTTVNLRIQDLPKDKFEEAMVFNINYFVKHEIFHRAAGVMNNPEALKECREFVSEMLREDSSHIAICCMDNSPLVNEIIGVSSMSLMTSDEDFDLDDLQINTKEWQRFFDIIEVQHSMYDIMTELKIDKMYDGRGIAVHPDYRGLGIATEFCKIRPLVCKKRDVCITSAWMTSLGSQKAAERAGWETAFQIPFSDLEQKLELKFDNAPPMLKVMLARVP